MPGFKSPGTKCATDGIPFETGDLHVGPKRARPRRRHRFRNPIRTFIARTVAVDNLGTGQTDTLAPLKVGIQSNDRPRPAGDGPWEIQWSRYDLANTSIRQYRTILNNYLNAWNLGSVTEPWFDGMGNWRFQGDPQPLRPLSTQNTARTTPVLLPACSQFIVEFAGDFLEQSDGSGTPGNTAPAGTLVDKDGNALWRSRRCAVQ